MVGHAFGVDENAAYANVQFRAAHVIEKRFDVANALFRNGVAARYKGDARVAERINAVVNMRVQLFRKWLRLLSGQIFARKVDDEHMQVLLQLVPEHRKALSDLISVLFDLAFLQFLEQMRVIQRFVQEKRVAALHVDAQYLRDGGNHVNAAFSQLAFFGKEAD